MQCHDGPRRGRLPESDVGHRAGAAQDADAALASPRKRGDAVRDVASVCDLHHVGSQRIGTVPRDDDRGLRLVLGSGGPAPWPPGHFTASLGSRPTGSIIVALAPPVHFFLVVFVAVTLLLSPPHVEAAATGAAVLVLGILVELVARVVLLEVEVAHVERRWERVAMG